MLRYHNNRGLAFLVVNPEGSRDDMKTRPVGFHARIQFPNAEKPKWYYAPNKEENGYSIHALPFFVGEFAQARLLIITEGEWDACTFGLAAGWLGDECALPEGVGLIGIRGNEGVEPFLQYYRPYWPKDVDCLVIPDGDTPGQSGMRVQVASSPS
jgi:hypothetical protein